MRRREAGLISGAASSAIHRRRGPREPAPEICGRPSAPAMGEIYICVPALEEKSPIARGNAAIGVTRGVADAVCLGLDDAAARHAFGQAVNAISWDPKRGFLRFS